LIGLALLLAVIATLGFRGLGIPDPEGPYAVGRYKAAVVDPARLEEHNANGRLNRVAPLEVWYPAEVGTGSRANYVPDLDLISNDLAVAGGLSPLVVWSLGLVRSSAFTGAIPIESDGLPLLVFSPGNQTNVSFYAALAEDLASRGYLVVGVDHPYQVAAVLLPDGTVATYDFSMDTLPTREGVEAKVEERVADIELVVDELLSHPDDALRVAIDSTRIGVLGHSLGGLAAAEVCRSDDRIVACLNIDGQGEGGPFGINLEDSAFADPFMFLTKESEIHPEIAARFEAAGTGSSRVVVPAADHGDFADGGLFASAYHPFDTTALDVIQVTRGFIASFFFQAMESVEEWRFDDIDAPTDVFVNVFPLGSRPPIPVLDG
jgi:dienelactone hydrolase